MDDDKDKSQPIDDESKVEESTTPAPAEEQPEEQVEEQVEEPELEEVEEAEDIEPEETPPSPRENRRIQQLVSKLRGQPQYGQPPTQQQIDYSQVVDADPETLQYLQGQTQQYGNAQYNAGLEQAKSIRFVNRLEIDAPRVEAKHKFLDSSDPASFKPEAANAINEMYLGLTGYDEQTGSVANPNLRYGEFVDLITDVANMIANGKVTNTTRNVARQAAQTGIRPDGSSTKRLNLNKSPEQMSTEELRARINSDIAAGVRSN